MTGHRGLRLIAISRAAREEPHGCDRWRGASGFCEAGYLDGSQTNFDTLKLHVPLCASA